MRQNFEKTFSIRFMLALLLTSLASLSADAQCSLNQIEKLLPSDGAANDWFGNSVSISGNISIVGAYNSNNDSGIKTGAAYLFDNSTGQQLAKLLPDDGENDDWFGFSVAISGATAIVGAYKTDVNGPNSGSVYVFDATTGLQTDTLLPDDGAVDNNFGFSVAIDGTTAIVGATGSGAAYLFDVATGQQIAKLLPGDGAANNGFGANVSISGTVAIVGASQDDDNGTNSGAAYLFDATNGQYISKLLPNDGAPGDEFGSSVSLDGTKALIGAIRDDDNGENSGSAYLFDTITGQQTAKILADDGASSDLFGASVSISGPIAMVGAINDRDATNTATGSAYYFDTTTGQQTAKLVADDGAGGDIFGCSVSISGMTAIVGAYGDDDNGSTSGSAYTFNVLFGCEQLVADTITVTRGTLASGGVFELAKSDNADVTIQRSASDIQPRTEFELKAISPFASPLVLEMTLEGAVFARSSVIQSVELFNYMSNQWEIIDIGLASQITDSSVTAVATGVLSRFVEPGTLCLKARVRFQAAVARAQFSSNTDQFIWTIGQ